MLGNIIGWILKFAGIIIGLIVFLYVITLIPAGPLSVLAGGVLGGIGWLFGTALPELGQIALDAARERL